MSKIALNPELSHKRLFLLGFSSLVLCVSMVMAIFAPFPLALAQVLYGRAKGLTVGLLFFLVSGVLGYYVFHDLMMVGVFALSLVMSVLLSEIIKHNIAPIKGLVGLGFVLVFLSAGVIGVGMFNNKRPLYSFLKDRVTELSNEVVKKKEEYLSQGGDDAREMVDMLSSPDRMVNEIIQTVPVALFLGIFFTVWVNLFLLIKAERMLNMESNYQYQEESLFAIKVPDFFVWPLMLLLFSYVWGPDLALQVGKDQNFGEWVQVVSLGLVKCLGLFYFFQGMGVFIKFLNFVGVGGLFRSLTVIFVVFSAAWLVALVGLFDNWFNFERFLKKKTTHKE